MKMTFAVLLYLLQRQNRYPDMVIETDTGEHRNREVQRLRLLKNNSEEQVWADIPGGRETL